VVRRGEDVGTFEDEWARIKRDHSGGGAGTELASAHGGDAKSPWGDGSSGGSGAGRVKSRKAAWSRAAHGVGSLRGDISKALTGLEDDQKGLSAESGTGSGSLESAAAQRALYRSWHRYLSDVSARCATLQGKLEKAGSDHTKNDDSTASSFTGLDKRYEDTDAVGGNGHGHQGGKG